MQWSPLVVFWQGHLDPYQAFLRAPHSGRFILSQAPNDLHLTFFVLAPLAWLSFPAAKVAWALANLLWLGLIAALMRSDPRAPAPWTPLLMLLASTATRVTIENGQLGLFCLLCFIGYVRLADRRPGLAGVIASLGAIKYSFGAPMAFQMPLKVRPWAAFALLPVAAVLFWAVHFHIGPVQALVLPLKVAAADIAPKDGVGDLMMFARAAGLSATTSLAAAALVLVAVAAIQKRFLPTEDRLALCAFYAALSLWLVYHRIYDFVFLAPAAVLAARASSPIVRYGLLACVVFFWFGFEILIRFGVPMQPVLNNLLLVAALGLIGYHIRIAGPAAPAAAASAS